MAEKYSSFVNFMLTEKQRNELNNIATKNNISVSEIIRCALVECKIITDAKPVFDIKKIAEKIDP